MPTSARFPEGRSQHFTFPRRELLQRLASVTLLYLVPRPQSKYGSPLFVIGDKVADYWIDEFNKECIEYGNVCGVCWHPDEREWAYSIEWTGGGMPDSCYPCFDNNLTIGGDLRLVSHA
ncbi:hypothetical protein [Microcoleus sp. Pol17_C1]|uniref:hypothetical protein n=1 Tax=unclassified Microcoleus TaxID=2642155 RepID=UPI002FD33643